MKPPCKNLAVVVEIDGSSHDDKKDYDQIRDEFLKNLGLKVIHIRDSEVKENIQGVFEFLGLELGTPRPSGTPLGEGNLWHVVSKKKIGENGEWNLSGERYRESDELRNMNYELVELGKVCETTSGGTPLKAKVEYYEEGTVPWLRSGEVAQGLVRKSELFITEEGLKHSSAKLFPIDTVLIAMYGATAGQVGLLKFESTTNQAICGVLPCSDYIPEFLFQILKSKKEDMIRLAGGGAQPNISQKLIKQIEIPLPPVNAPPAKAGGFRLRL